MFRVNSRARKGTGVSSGADFSISLPESGEASYLFTPNIVRYSRVCSNVELTYSPGLQPFELDYFQVLFTTCDMLAETYTKILSYLGPSSGGAPIPAGFPQPPGAAVSGSNLGASERGPAAAGLSPALTEVVLKIDGRLTVRSPRFVCRSSRANECLDRNSSRS